MRVRAVLAAVITCCLAVAGLVAWGSGDGHGPSVTGNPARSLAGVAVPWPREGQAAVEVDDRGSLGSSGGTEPVPIASLAKVMTAYLVLQQHPLRYDDHGFTVTFSDADVADYEQRAGNDESVVAVATGEVMDERQLLEALLLPSANNVAAVLAVHEAGSIEQFVARMNATAAGLGMHHTTYTDPSGLDEGTVSTAADQLRLVVAALDQPGFATIVRLRSVELPVAGQVRNTNPLVGIDGFAGVKTGSDDAAGGCLAFATLRTVRGQSVRVVGVVLGQHGGPLLQAAGRAARPLVEAAYQAVAGAAGK